MSEAENLSPVKRAIVELREMKARLDEIEYARAEPIAIIGLGMRYPGDANTPDSFWELLRDGVDAISDIPPDRWNIDDYYDPDAEVPGKMSTLGGGFIRNIDQFEPGFFGISPREAASMDPQQRILVEVTWEALENAGQSPESLMGTQTGVFVGMSTNDYGRLVSADINNVDVYYATGNNYSVAAGRLSYILGLQGPSVVVDTACSSSLVALHLAAQSLRSGESNLALAGGVNIILAPETNVNFSKAGMMAADDRCKTFDANADGYVRGEGCGVIVLKRLSDALKEGDHILALVRGTAINQDGRSSGLTAPNGPSQEAVIRAALANAGVAPAQIDYVEAHGTGTPLGDPIEVRALAAVLSEGRPADRPLMIGSVKTNIGHTEAAAGVAGLIKLVLSMQQGEIPPHLHLQTLNPYIPWDQMSVIVPTSRTPWPASDDKKRFAGVSSFGFSGTNAHVILEEAPEVAPHPSDYPHPPITSPLHREGEQVPAPLSETDRSLNVTAFSARTGEALVEQARGIEAHLAANPGLPPGDVAFTLNAGRSHFPHRLAITAESTAQLREKLAAFINGQEADGVIVGEAQTVAPPEIAFLFSGQGAQYAQMGRQLYETSPVFRAALDQCDELARVHLSQSLVSVLYPMRVEAGFSSAPTQDTVSLFDQMTYAQPAIFAVEYALAQLWHSWGIQPTMVMGHSVGEYVAAVIAGIFSLEDGLKLVATRGRLMDSLPNSGEMVAVLADEERVAAAIAPYADRVSIAAVNGPQNITISGEAAAVAAILAELKKERIHARRLNVTQASHSPMLDPILDEFESVARSVTYYPAQIGLISGMTGQLITRVDARYWRDHTRQAVQFSKAMLTLHEQGYRLFLEIGPNPTLLALGRRCVPNEEGLWLPSLREGFTDWTQMLESLSLLYVNGVNPAWNEFDRDYARKKLPLPTYPWKRARYWVDSVPQRPQSHKPLWETLVENALRQSENGPLDLGVQTYPAKWWHLNRLTLNYMTRTLRQLGVFTTPNERYSLDDLMQTCRITPGYQPLIRHWLDGLTEAGILQRYSDGDNDQYTTPEPLPEPDIEALWGEAVDDLMDIQPLADYLKRCGHSLAALLTGAESPLETMFPGGSYDTVDFLYNRWAVPRYYNGIMRSVIESAANQGRPLRVLEVGAGTGGATASIVSALPQDRTIYHFTDISDFFLGRAQERFAAYPFMRYGFLNIENDPQEQGYAPGSFDIIIAANVLPATINLDQTLQHVRRLLAPGGLLVLYDVTHHPHWFDITIGLVARWSHLEDEWRRDDPLLTAQVWAQALAANGFQSIAAFPEASATSEILLHHVIVAQTPFDAVLGTSIDFGDLAGANYDAAPIASAQQEETENFLRQLFEALPTERQDMLIAYVRRHLARILRMDPSQPIERRQRLMDMGVDSLMAVELRSKLSAGLNLPQILPATLIFDYPTIEAIVEYLERILMPEEQLVEVYTPAALPDETMTGDIEGMSDDEVEALLLKKLKNM